MKKIFVILILLIIVVAGFYFGFYFGKNAINNKKDNIEKGKEVEEETSIVTSNIKERGELETYGLWSFDGVSSDTDMDLQMTDMTWNEECGLYHKIITNINDYNKFSKRIKIPELKESDFNDVFMVIVSNERMRGESESDLLIYDVYADRTTTHIILKQKENPRVYAETNVFYAIVDNSQLKQNADVSIEY